MIKAANSGRESADGWEQAHGLDPVHANDASEDSDGDGLSDAHELSLGTDPNNPDTDGDGIPDGWEIGHGMNPLDPVDASEDWDGDGLGNLDEYVLGTDMLDPDTDGDGIPDGWETAHGLNPLDAADGSADGDGDGLTNQQEFQYGTDPNLADADTVPGDLEAVTLTVSLSRWGHDLRLCQADGREFPLDPESSPGNLVPGSTGVLDDTWYFSYRTSRRQASAGGDWWIHDATTNDDSPLNPSDAVLAQWAWLLTPVNPQAVPLGPGAVLVSWRTSRPVHRFAEGGVPLPAAASGGFRIDLGVGPLAWQPIATAAAPDMEVPQAGGRFQFPHLGLAPGQGYSYRINYFYGGKWATPVETGGGNVEDMPPQDSDGDGYSDAEELAAGTDPYDPASKPAYPPLTTVDANGKWPQDIILANDSRDYQLFAAGGDGSPITYTLDSISYGTPDVVTADGGLVTENGGIRYNAPSFAYCIDTIGYTVQQNGASKKGKLIIYVMPNLPDAVKAENQDLSTPFDKLVKIDLNASVTEGFVPYRFTVSDKPADNPDKPKNGSLIYSVGPDGRFDGHLIYTPKPGYMGNDSFKYTVYDNAYDSAGDKDVHTATATVTIHVTPPQVSMDWTAIQGWYNVDDNRSMVDFNYFPGKAPPDDRWLPGRGRRIFPDKKNMNDYIRNKAVLQIHTTPKAPGTKVFLKAFDVDDATLEDFDKEANTGNPEIDTNGLKGNDNKDNDPTRLKTGQFIVGGVKMGAEREVTLDPKGDARVIFETTMQPGDNFRVALAFKQEDLIPLKVDDPNGSGFVDGQSEQQPSGFSGVVSPMLTVWRKLNIEVDSMASVPSPRGAPDELIAVGDGLDDAVDGKRTLKIKPGAALSPLKDFYAGGTVESALQTLEIIGSTENCLTVTSKNMTFQEEQSFFGPITVRDDDLRFLPDDFQPLLPRYNLINDRVIGKYIPAYIQLRDAASDNPRKQIPFKLYEDVGVTSSLDNFQDLEDSDGYWAHLVVAAYQRAVDDCGDPFDPQHPEGTRGITLVPVYVLGSGFYHSAIFLETIRDRFGGSTQLANPDSRSFYQQEFRNEVDATVIHEIGHGPPKIDGVDHHDEGGMMQEGGGQIQNTFSTHTIKRFRGTKSWSKQQ